MSGSQLLNPFRFRKHRKVLARRVIDYKGSGSCFAVRECFHDTFDRDVSRGFNFKAEKFENPLGHEFVFPICDQR